MCKPLILLMYKLFIHCLMLLLGVGLTGCNKPVKDFSSNESAIPRPIMSISFFENNFLWVATEKGDLKRSLDAGEHWENAQPQGKVRLVDFINGQQGWAITNRSKILQTMDGGYSWKVIGELGSVNEPHDLPVLQLKFINESVGFALDPFTLWETKDGGVRWRKNSLSNDSSSTKATHVREMFFNTGTYWVLGLGHTLWKSTDKGSSWLRKDVLAEGTDIRTLFFVNDRTGWLASIGMKDKIPTNGIYRTDDGGESWQLQKLPEGEITIKSIYFINEKEGWAVGNERVLRTGADSYGRAIAFHTLDGGETWVSALTSREEIFYEKVYFIDIINGWLVSNKALYRTNDGGETWKMVLRPTA